jgi:hypothetical protein
MAQLFEGQLRDCDGTAFTVVLPMVGLKSWSRYLKHFRWKEAHVVQVEGLGEVKHWLLRYEKGDGSLPRGEAGQTTSVGRAWAQVEGMEDAMVENLEAQ